MRIISLQSEADWPMAVQEAVRTLEYSGTVVYPTDTVYGLGANALNPVAVRKIFRIKERSTEKALPILARNLFWASELAHIEGRNKDIARAVWPGQVTLVLPKKDIVPGDTTGGMHTVALRVCEHPFVNALLDAFGYPLTGASANVSGHEGLRDISAVLQEFEQASYQPDLVIDAGVLPPSGPSTVLDVSNTRPKILRVGATRPEELMKILEL
ncbi:MAG: L-threonylcarbamoyladenylate synthase [Patescibacteria group bacterium]